MNIINSKVDVDIHPQVHITIYTALLKCYAHVGLMHKASDLFRRLCQYSMKPQTRVKTATSKGKLNHHTARRHCRHKFPPCTPNVRTLNTVLRGCLWTAVSLDEATGTLAGGVVSSEVAWKYYNDMLAQQQQQQQYAHAMENRVDASSYEMTILILCQALQTDKAVSRIAEWKQRMGVRFKGTASLSFYKPNGTSLPGDHNNPQQEPPTTQNRPIVDPTDLETLAVCYVALGRVFALTHQGASTWQACQRAIRVIQAIRELSNNLDSVRDADAIDSSKIHKLPAQGGRRSWKPVKDVGDSVEAHEKRKTSNSAFRSHRLSELEAEAKLLLRYRGREPCEETKRVLVRKILSRLSYTPRGKRTDEGENSYQSSLVAMWYSFGLSCLLYRGNDVELWDVICRASAIEALLDEKKIEMETIQQFIKRNRDLQNSSVEIEIGAGSGDWITNQASKSVHERCFIGVEMRSDRVAHMFARAMLHESGPLDNLYFVGAEASSCLRDRVLTKSVSAVYANFPEPPTQFIGSNEGEISSIMLGGDEPVHMLNSETIAAVANCLMPRKGRLVIVSDNKSYVRLIAATIVKTNRHIELIHSATQKEMKNAGFREVETLGANNKIAVTIFEGTPNSFIGHCSVPERGSSYFDRLWRTGAGSHSERQARFVIVMHRK
jgi:pentatricopeptide repeat protein